jgi:hypothetical protein
MSPDRYEIVTATNRKNRFWIIDKDGREDVVCMTTALQLAERVHDALEAYEASRQGGEDQGTPT